jgi:serine/arginine repetitive matrix protein 2
MRARARGHGHRRRISEARMSRASVYETIEEETPNASPAHLSESKKSSPTINQPVYVVDETTMDVDMEDRNSMSMWDDERGIVALRRFFDLRDEAETALTESRRMWLDTPFSLYALQCKSSLL